MRAVILAAGRGTRLEPLTDNMPKCMLPLASRPLLSHIFDAVKEAGIRSVILVLGYKKEEVRSYLEKRTTGLDIEYAIQKKRLGTADALSKVSVDEDFIVLNGDNLITGDSLKRIIAEHDSAATLGLRMVENPENYGVVKVKEGNIVEIKEKPKRWDSNLVSGGLYAFSPKILDAVKRVGKSSRGEYELPSAIELLIKDGEEVKGIELKERWLDIGSPWEYLDSNRAVLEEMDADRKGTVEEFVKITGKVCIGKNSVIKSGTYIEGPVFIGENTVIGPNSFLRSFTSVGNNCKVGNAVEIKNSIVMDGTKIPHLSYVGDSIIGRNCNLGAGTLVGNLRLDNRNVAMRIKGRMMDTGRRKMGCVIGDNVKTGISVMINAGRKIGSNSLVGPGVIVYRDIPSNSFILQKQEIKNR